MRSLSQTERVAPRKSRRDSRRSDRIFSKILASLSIGVAALLFGIVIMLGELSWPAWKSFGWGFFTSVEWDPVNEIFGGASAIYGTLVSSLISLVLSVPVSIGVAVFLTEVAPRKISIAIAFLVEMLAAIPSVVYGLWGIFYLAPTMRELVQPFLQKHFGSLPLFQGPPYGVGMLSAGVILAIMITPTITAICREVFRAIPQSQREGAQALGATRWETIRLGVLSASGIGIFGAVILGLGRALGETMAVTMVIGNRSEISSSLFAPGQTMASVIANEYAEATGEMHLATLGAVGLSLFLVSFLVNSVAQVFINRMLKKERG